MNHDQSSIKRENQATGSANAPLSEATTSAIGCHQHAIEDNQRKATTYGDRLAFSPAEFAHLFGRSETWGYRQLYKGAIKAIRGDGRIMIPKSEIERFAGNTALYAEIVEEQVGSKPKRKGDGETGGAI